jgi:hypothetical protein
VSLSLVFSLEFQFTFLGVSLDKRVMWALLKMKFFYIEHIQQSVLK